MHSLHLAKDIALEILTSIKYSLIPFLKEDCDTRGKPILLISSFSIFHIKPLDILYDNNFKAFLVPSSLINRVRCGDLSEFSTTILLIVATYATMFSLVFSKPLLPYTTITSQLKNILL